MTPRENEIIKQALAVVLLTALRLQPRAGNLPTRSPSLRPNDRHRNDAAAAPSPERKTDNAQ